MFCMHIYDLFMIYDRVCERMYIMYQSNSTQFTENRLRFEQQTFSAKRGEPGWLLTLIQRNIGQLVSVHLLPLLKLQSDYNSKTKLKMNVIPEEIQLNGRNPTQSNEGR